MEFQPNTTIMLCNVPFDNTYKHQVVFSSPETQGKYFQARERVTLTEYLTVREKLPDGSVLSYIRVDEDIESLKSMGCNYVVYRNGYSGKLTFAFITKMVYINEGLTKLFIETDVWQTYCFDVELMKSFVVRQHSESDEIGDNVVPEQFNYNGYDYHNLNVSNLDQWGYLVGTNTPHTSSAVSIGVKSGIAQGLYFYYFKDVTPMSVFLESLDNDCVEFITVIPKFCIGDAVITNVFDDDEGVYSGNGYVGKSDSPALTILSVDFSGKAFTFDGYTPKNNKLWTSPFSNVSIINGAGGELVLNREDFETSNKLMFNLYGDTSTNPSVMLVPLLYKGLYENYNYTISISNFPQCSYSADYFKLWSAKNVNTVFTENLANAVKISGGIVSVATGVGTGVGAMAIASGAVGVTKTINSIYQATVQENPSTVGKPHNNLLTAMKKNKFTFYYRMIKRDFAESVDNFFTMYGYAVNKLCDINLRARPCFTYIETIDVNIKGDIPSDDMKRIKDMFNGGVTMWEETATMYDYDVDNSPNAVIIT